MNLKYTKLLFIQLLISLCAATSFAQYSPVSDPSNSGNWIFNPDVSDEFNGNSLDKSKWWILGENNDYRAKWKGRAPGQFAPNNVIVTGGNLIIRSEWDPNFDFADENDGSGNPYGGGKDINGDWIQPITQACIMSERFFQYGYMEIRCQSADAPVTNAFWTTGYHSEIDMTENYGKRPIGNPEGTSETIERRQRTNLISWDPAQADPDNHKTNTLMTERSASRFFVFGFEWNATELKIYIDGVWQETITKSFMESQGIRWVWDFPQEIWLDSEVFSWYGLPSEDDLTTPGDFKIDYVRIWQKELNSGDDFDALGFEGPFYFSGRSNNWYSIGGNPQKWSMQDAKPKTGNFSLEFKHSGAKSGNYTAYTPYGCLDIPSGNNTMNMMVWIDASTDVKQIDVTLRNPWKQFTIDISGLTKGQWVPVSIPFTRNGASDPSITNGDRIELQIKSENIISSSALIYIDDIYFNDPPLSINENKTKKLFKIYPNPASDFLTIISEKNSSIKITNNLGATVKLINNVAVSEQVDVSNLTTGIYYVTVTSNGRSEVQKVIIK